MSTLLTCRDLTKAFGLRVLFENLSLGFFEGERVGLLGPNGAGKTTLLQMIAGLQEPDRGEINRRRGLRLDYLRQEDAFPPDSTLISVLDEALRPYHPQDHDRATRINIVLSQFDLGDGTQATATLSGGWRKRLAIARAMSTAPDLLLMDEPTNHLDIEGIQWLEDRLERAPFAFVAVSHDRYFLERVTTRVVELNSAYPEGAFSVPGNYSTFLEKRAEFLEAQQAQETALASVVRREAAFLKSKAKARRTKSKARIETAYRLQDELKDLQRRNAEGNTAGIDFEGTGRRSRKLLEAKGLSKELGGRRLFADVDVLLSPGSRLGIVGANGSGKSTLIRVLSGEWPADTGSIRNAEGLRVVLFEQDRATLDPEMSLRRALAGNNDAIEFRGRPVHVAAWANRFLFRRDQMELPVKELSGGEQARILIAQLMLHPADVLILDEPTNDLDIASLDILEESLADFPGAVILVTHDRFMLDRLCTELIGLDVGGRTGHYASCEQWLAARRQDMTAEAAAAKTRKDKPRRPRDHMTASERKELQDMEMTIADAEAAAERCQEAVEDDAVASDAEALQQRWVALETARAAVDRLYARWQELEERSSG